MPQKFGHPTLAVQHDTLAGNLEYSRLLVASGSMPYKHRELTHEQAKKIIGTPHLGLKVHNTSQHNNNNLLLDYNHITTIPLLYVVYDPHSLIVMYVLYVVCYISVNS